MQLAIDKAIAIATSVKIEKIQTTTTNISGN